MLKICVESAKILKNPYIRRILRKFIIDMEELNKELNETKTLNFLEEIIEADLASGKCDSIMTRFPPEPNGYLRKGH